jgi:flagellar FliJ protein
MKQFSFNLESVLNHRKLLEEVEEQKLNKVLCSVRQMETLRDSMQNEAKECRFLLHKPDPGEINVDELRQMVAYLQKLEQEIHECLILLSRLQEDRKIQSEKLVEARKKREILEKLRDRSFANYQTELKGLEQKLQDELATERFGIANEQNLPGAEK